MAVIYSESTQKFLKELTRITKIAHNPEDRHLKTPKQLKGVRKLYENDTSKFEPIAKNREHLITTLMPLVVKLAKQISGKYGAKVEYDDCISSGLQGAIIATDIYIEKSKTSVQPAKLSTYAYSYITKYINEYCWSSNSILSHGPTKWWQASQQHVLSGNQTYTSDGKATEFFDIIADSSMVNSQEDILSEEEMYCTSMLSNKLCSTLTDFDKHVICMTFGIGSVYNQSLSPHKIAKRLHCTLADITRSIESSIEFLQTQVTQEELSYYLTSSY